MKKSKPTPAIIDVLLFILNYFLSLKFFFKKEFITELYWKHLVYSLLLSLLPFGALLVFFHLEETPILVQMFVNGLTCFVVNLIRENIKEYEAKKQNWEYPYDIVDVYFGSYGGVLAVPVVHLLLLVIR